MTLEMWLDLGAHPTSCFAQFAADRQNPSRVQHDVALQLAWLDISRSTRDVCRLPFCGLSATDGLGWGTKFCTCRRPGVPCGLGQVCLDLMSLTCPYGDETAEGSTHHSAG